MDYIIEPNSRFPQHMPRRVTLRSFWIGSPGKRTRCWRLDGAGHSWTLKPPHAFRLADLLVWLSERGFEPIKGSRPARFQCNVFSEFHRGFMFGLNVLESLGLKPDWNTMLDQLRAIEQGDFTLIDSPEETIRQFVVANGGWVEKEFTEALCESLAFHRSKNQAAERWQARHMLRLLDPGR
jgi:hypothetical protein